MSLPLALSSVTSSTLFFGYGQARSLQNQNKSALDFYIAGTYAGILQTFIETPLEHIKIRLQSQYGKSLGGPIGCLKYINNQGGPFAVFKGLSATMLRNAPSYGVYFATYEIVKDSFPRNGDSASPLAMFIGGGLGGILSWAVIYPIDVIKTKIQSDDIRKPRYKNMKECAIMTYKEAGIQGFTKGLNTTLARTFVVSGVNFLGYEFTIKLLKHIQRN